MNWFALAVATLQFLAAGQYLWQQKYDHGLLWLLYGLANIVLIRMAR